MHKSLLRQRGGKSKATLEADIASGISMICYEHTLYLAPKTGESIGDNVVGYDASSPDHLTPLVSHDFEAADRGDLSKSRGLMSPPPEAASSPIRQRQR